MDKRLTDATETKEDNTYELGKPFEYEGVTYEKLTFDWNKLTGEDMAKIENEIMANGGGIVINPAFSGAFLTAMAAKAAGVNIVVINAMPIKDALAIRNAAKNFLFSGE